MPQLPEWWIYVSGICFAASLLLNLVLIGVAIMLARKIGPLVSQVQQLVKTTGDKVTHIATTAENTVSTVHTRTTQILGSTEEASAEVTKRISTVGAALTALFVVTRLVGAFRGASGHARKH